MKKKVAVLIALICLCFLSGCQYILELHNIEEVADVYYDNDTSLQAAVDALLSMDISFPIYIDPIERGSVHYFHECEIDRLRFESNAVDEELFDADCHRLYDTIEPLFEELNLWGIRISHDEISFVLEYNEGFAAELFYVYDENADSFSTRRIVEDELQINDCWYAVKTYEPDISP